MTFETPKDPERTEDEVEPTAADVKAEEATEVVVEADAEAEGEPSAAPSDTGAEEVVAAGEPEAPVGPAAEAPKPRRRRGRKATEEAELGPETSSTEAEAPSTEAPVAEVEAPASEPEAPVAPATEADAPATEAEAPATPARSRRRRGGGGAEPAVSERSTAPAPTRRRRGERPAGPPPVVRAQAKYVRSSARKARLVCDHIRGKTVEEARAILAHTPRAVARDWSKLLESAVANAEHNHELVGEDLYIKAVHADEGPTIRRFRPRAMGRATRIRKRTSHLTILLTPKE